jgi:predicted nucleotidyltransferase
MPRGTAAVLRALSGADEEFTIRQLARLAGVSANRAHQVVERLARHGLVITRDVRPARLCRLNRDHLAADAVTDLLWLRPRMVEAIRAELESWAVLPLHASLFGSAARGDGDEESDLDVLVVRANEVDPEGSWGGQLMDGAARLSGATGNDVRWFDLTRDDLLDAARREEPIVGEWMRDGLLLHGAGLRTLLRGCPH